MEFIKIKNTTTGTTYEIELSPEEKKRFIIGKVILLIYFFCYKIFIENCLMIILFDNNNVINM